MNLSVLGEMEVFLSLKLKRYKIKMKKLNYFKNFRQMKIKFGALIILVMKNLLLVEETQEYLPYGNILKTPKNFLII
jgi:hypothetical protein